MTGDDFILQGTGRFEQVACLGRGGMGVVYEVLDRLTGGRAALKLMTGCDPEAQHRFKQEFRALQDFEHTNVVTLGELGQLGDALYFTMELIDGVDFVSYVTRHERAPVASTTTVPGHTTRETVRLAPTPRRLASAEVPRFDEGRLRACLRQLATALAAIHASGKVHRDVKPSNILVTPEGRLVLLDFGLVLTEEEGARLTGNRVVGSLAYMAPELLDPARASPACDCHAVGAILYEAMTGALPWDGTSLEILVRKQSMPLVPASEFAAGVPADLDLLVRRLLDPDPARRPTAEDILAMVGADEATPERTRRTTSPRPYFVGRKHELERLLALADGRTAATVLLRAESGLGKTALAERFVELLQVAHPRALALHGRCYERENVPFKGLDRVIDDLAQKVSRLAEADREALLENAAVLAEVFPTLRRIPGVHEIVPELEIADPHTRWRRVFTALRSLLARLAQQRPVVVWIDDLQWANADSWAVVEHLMHPPDPPPVLLLLTLRPSSVPVQFTGTTVELGLGTLAEADMRELAAQLVERSGLVIAPERVAREAEGHPLFLHQLVDHLTDVGGGLLAIDLETAVTARVAALPAAALRLLRMTSTAAMPMPHEVMQVATQLGYADYTRAVSQLCRVHLARTTGVRTSDSIEHYHDRLRELVLQAIAPAERRVLHQQLASALEATGLAVREPELAMTHLEAAGHRDRAADYARHAAERARERLAFNRAAALYETALRLGSFDADTTRALRRAQAAATVDAGRGARAAELFLAMGDLDDNRTNRLDCLRLAAEQLLLAGYVTRGVEVLARVLAEVEETLPATPRRALAELMWQRVRLRLRGLAWTKRDPSEIPRRDLVRLDVYRAVGRGLSLVDNIRGADFQCRHLRLALDLGQPDAILQAMTIEAVFLASQHVTARARRITAHVEQWARELGTPDARGYACFGRAAVMWFIDNDWVGVHAVMEEAEACFSQCQTGGWEIDTARLYRCLALLYQGDLPALRRSVPEYVHDADQRGDRYGSVNLRTRVIHHWLADDAPERARAELRIALDPWPPWRDNFLVQHYLALYSECEIALYVNEPEIADAILFERAAALAGSQLLRVPMVVAEVAYLRGRVLIARALNRPAGPGRLELARAALRVARQLARVPVPIAREWSLLVEAGARRARGDDDGAMSTMVAAIEALDRGGSRLHAHLARAALGDVASEAWLECAGIVDRTHYRRMLAPGW